MGFWDFFWIILWAFYVVAYIWVIFFVISDLFRDESIGGWGRAAWIIALILVPFLTGIIYVVARGDGIAARANASRSRAPESDEYRPAASASPAADIAQAKQLLDEGVISQGEFDALKSKALGNQFFGA